MSFLWLGFCPWILLGNQEGSSCGKTLHCNCRDQTKSNFGERVWAYSLPLLEPKICADLAPWNSPPVWAALLHLQGYLCSDPLISLQPKVTFSNFSKRFSKPSDFWTLTNVDLFCKNHLKCPIFLEALHDFLTFPSICSGIVRKYLLLFASPCKNHRLTCEAPQQELLKAWDSVTLTLASLSSSPVSAFWTLNKYWRMKGQGKS